MNLDILTAAVGHAFSISSILYLIVGTLWGTLVGALPGLGSIIAITMVLPFTYQLSSIGALSLIMGVYCGAVYGGCISAILLNTPGTPQSAATCFDGFPMTKQGKAGEALGWATSASVVGGLFSCVLLIIMGPTLATFAQNFGPIETFALIVMALSCISGVSQGGLAKGLLAGCTGLFLGTIGIDPMNGNTRFTFDIFQLHGGIDLIALVVGIFAIAEVLCRALESNDGNQTALTSFSGMIFPKLSQWKSRIGNLVKSSLIGSVVGILPGTGAATASFIAYAEAKRTSNFAKHFGTGEPDGIVAPEASNNAVTGGALIPTLALGIPGDPVTAVMMVTLVIHGMTPGVRLMKDNPDTVMAAFILLFLANLLLAPIGKLVSRLFAKILRLPEPLLMGGVSVLCVLGVYGNSYNEFHLLVAFIAGVAGVIMRLLNIPVASLVIGFVLSNQLEVSLRQALIMTDNNLLMFLQRPVAVFLFLLTAFVLLFPVIQKRFKEKRKTVS